MIVRIRMIRSNAGLHRCAGAVKSVKTSTKETFFSEFNAWGVAAFETDERR